MNRQFERYLKITLIALDLITLNLLYLLCQIIFTNRIGFKLMDEYIIYWLISNAFWLILSFFLRTYADKTTISFETFTKRTIQVYLLWIIFIMFYLFFSRELKISRLFIITTIDSLLYLNKRKQG